MTPSDPGDELKPHPEDHCSSCGARNPSWFGPEFVELVGSSAGILCPTCFASLDPTATWVITRLVRDVDQTQRLADVLRGCLADPSDAERLAGCVIDAGWRRHDAVEIIYGRGMALESPRERKARADAIVERMRSAPR